MKFYSKARRARRRKCYGSRYWRKLSLRHRKNNPFCVRCLARGQHKLADVADHDNPVWEGRGILTAKLNALCHECHKDKTIIEDFEKIKIAELTAFKFF